MLAFFEKTDCLFYIGSILLIIICLIILQQCYKAGIERVAPICFSVFLALVIVYLFSSQPSDLGVIKMTNMRIFLNFYKALPEDLLYLLLIRLRNFTIAFILLNILFYLFHPNKTILQNFPICDRVSNFLGAAAGLFLIIALVYFLAIPYVLVVKYQVEPLYGCFDTPFSYELIKVLYYLITIGL